MPTAAIDIQDIESVSSINSDEVGRIEMQSRLGKPSTLRVDGKVPDVVYSLHLLDMRNQVVNHLQSDKPFDKQVGQLDHCQESPLQDQGWSGEQPVIQLVIEVVNRIIAERPEAGAIPQPYAHNHHWRELAAYSSNQPSTHDGVYKTTTSHHIDGLLQFLDATFAPDLCDEEARHKLHNPVTTHEWSWTLFKPGQVVYTKLHGAWSAYIVSGIIPPRALDGRYDVYVWFVRARGNTLVREFTKFLVGMWEVEVPITSLAVVPEEYWMDDLQGQDGKKPRMPLRQKLIKEGKLLWELLKEPTSKQHNGELADEGIHIKDTQKGFVSGRVICDSPGFGEYCPDMKQQLQCQPRLTRPRSPPPENQ
ncbi:hypothetical protein MANI_121745 [Metarhizium anisopliae]|nr:hypothetical protein MANI_121745 [Metarhizium anisopliae]